MKTAREGTNRVWKWATVAAALFLAFGVATQMSIAAERKTRDANKAFMRMKLAWSDGVLEGLTLEKYDLVSRNAIRLRDMTQSNLWSAMKQPEYLRLTTNFQSSAGAVYMAAIEKNLDAATDAYVKMTRSCIECHRLVRVEQRPNVKSPRAGL